MLSLGVDRGTLVGIGRTIDRGAETDAGWTRETLADVAWAANKGAGIVVSHAVNGDDQAT